MYSVYIAAVAFLALAVAPVEALQADGNSAYAWPGGARAAVNLAYDDALDSQLDNAIPALDRHGFKGSFYLTLASESMRNRLEEWRSAAMNGHELGNHSIFHQCSASKPGREWVESWRDLDHVPLDEWLAQLTLANTMLQAIDGRVERTFTTPCGDLYAGGEYYVDAARPLFVAAKARFGGITEDMKAVDPHLVGVVGPVESSGEELIAIAREAAARGTMANFTFHGIGGDYLSVSNEAHEQLLEHLAENPDVYWVDTFLNIMRHVGKVNGDLERTDGE